MHIVVVKVKLMYMKINDIYESVSYTNIVLWFKGLLLDIYTKVDFINFKEKEKNFNDREISLEAGNSQSLTANVPSKTERAQSPEGGSEKNTHRTWSQMDLTHTQPGQLLAVAPPTNH